MKTIVGTLFLTLILMSSCKDKGPGRWENTLLQFNEISDSDYCNSNRRQSKGCTKGRMILTAGGKALYYFNCRHTDSTTFHRGTYAVKDSVIECLFDSRLTASKEKRGEKTGFKESKRRKVRLYTTGCEPDRAWLYSTDIRNDDDSSKVYTVFRKAELYAYNDFCMLTASLPALIDFKCQPRADTAYKNARSMDESILNMMVDHYKNKNPKSRMHRADNDSSINLSFTYLKKRQDDDGLPYLYVTISKIRKSYLSGDLNTDGVPDLVGLPKLSQGGASYWQDLFVLLYLKGNFEPVQVISAMDLARCTGNSYNGNFVPREISENMIKGTTRCYTDDDAECCPSVKLEASYKLDEKKLKFVAPPKKAKKK
jgi:hypothetical protein